MTQNQPQNKNRQLSIPERLNTMAKAPWFPPVVFIIIALLYFSPYLGLNKIMMGTDDGARGWHTIGNYGHGITSFADKWSPLNGGTAMMEMRYGRFINPTHLFHLFMQKYQARTLEYIFWTFIAGLCMFFFLRAIGISQISSYIGALVYMLAPSFQSYLFAGHFARMEVIALMPGVLYFTERMLQRIDLLDLIGLPVIMALCVYSEHLQLAYFVFFGMGFYFAFRMLWMVFKSREITLKIGIARTAFFSTALLLFTLLTAMNTFPSMHHTNVTSKRAGGVDYEYASSFSLHPEEMFSLVEPDFVGWKEDYWGQNALKLNNEYFGICIFLLALMLFLFGKQDFRKYLFAGFFVFAVLFSLGAHSPVHKIIYLTFPGMKAFRGPSFMYIWFVLPALALAAYALDNVLSYDWKEDPKRNKRVMIFAGVCTGFAFIYMITSQGFATYWYNKLYPVAMQNEYKYNALMHNMPKIKGGAVLIFLIITSFFTITYLKVKGTLSRNVFITLLIGIILIDLIRISHPFVAQCIKPANFYTRQEKVEQSIEKYLHQNDKSDFRVYSMLGDQKMYIPNLELTYIFDDFINKRYYDIVQVVQSSIYGLQQPQYANNPVLQTRFVNALSVLNTKYVLALSPLPVPGLREIINSGGLRIYENPTAFPRFYLAHEVSAESNIHDALMESLSRPDFNQNRVLVEKEAWGDKVLASSVDSSLSDAITIVSYDTRIGSAVLDISSSREQVLVVSENFNEGWKATVNNKPADVFTADYYAKAVIVPQGKSRVTFIYNSPSAVLWRKVTLISAVLFGIFSIVVIVIQILKKRKSSTAAESKKVE